MSEALATRRPTHALEIPDPRNQPVPTGWFESVAAPAILETIEWEALDEYEARLRAFASYVDSFDGDAAEFEKALRVVEKRRGDLLGADLHQGKPSASVREVGASPDTQERWRRLARSWEVVWPFLREATDKRAVTQAAVLRFIETGQTISALTSSDSNEWYTPSEFVEAARRVLGTIDLDPASCEAANKVVGAKHFLTEADDGLTVEWNGRVFMNPPFGNIGPKFVEKLCAEHAAGRVTAAVLVCAARCETQWFQPLFEHLVCFPSRRVQFWQPGRENVSPPFTPAFAYLGASGGGFAFVREFSRFGPVVRRVAHG